MVSEAPVSQPDAVKEPVKQAQEAVEPAANGEENGASHKEKAPGSAAASEEVNGEPAEEELWRRRLWFVRIPRPPEVGAVKALEQELETYRAQYKLLSESFNVKKVERDAARDNTRGARDAFKAVREAYEEKRAIVQPMRDAAQGTSAEAKKLREQFSELEVRTEAELDERLQGLHYRIEHESIPLNEEKRILQQIKKLESQRAKVREYESLVGTLAESRTEVKRLEGELAEHKAELAALQGEKNTQWTILEKFREQEQALDKEVEDILAERKRVKDIMDEAYSRVSELKSVQRAKNDEYYSNRRFSRSIRETLAAGKLEEAREMCSQQMEEAHAKLSSEADYRAEYFALWEQQRKAPVSMAALDEDDDLPAPRGGRGGDRRGAAEPAVEPAKKAEAVIAAVLEEARGEILRVKAAAASAAAAAAPAPAVAEPATLAPEPEPEPAPKPVAKLPKPRKEVAKPVVEVPVIPEEKFELPEVIRAARKAPSAEELKALEREHQRQVQLDAERRKQRKQQEAEKKRQRALREQAARQAAKAAAVAASSGAGTPLGESDAVPEASAGEESGREGAAGSGTEAPAPAAPAAIAPTAAGKAAAAAKTSKVAAINKPKSTARRPAHTKKPLGKQLKQFWKEYQTVLGVAGLVLVVLLLLILYVQQPKEARAPIRA